MVFTLFIYFRLRGVFLAECRLSVVVVSGGCSLVAVCRLLTVGASLVAEHKLSGTRASVVATHVLYSCSPCAQ